jgi:hypothetical protein
VLSTPPALATPREGTPDACLRQSYHARTAGVTGDKPLRVHFKATGHTYRVHAGTRRQALLDALANLGTATGRSDIKKLMTVLAWVKFLEPDISPAIRALLFDLLPPAAVKINRDIIRGTIAAGVAVLRSANMEPSRIERWLDEEFKRRALDLTGAGAMDLWYECSKETSLISRDTQDAYRSYSTPSVSLREAKERVGQILDRTVIMRAGPPRQSRRPR